MINIWLEGYNKPAVKLQFYIGLFIVALLVLFTNNASGQQNITLGWDAETNALVAGYTLQYGNASGSYTGTLDAGTNTALTLSNLSLAEKFYFTVSSYDANGLQSAPSSEVYVSPTMTDFLVGHVSWTNGIDLLTFPNGNLFGYYAWVGMPWMYHMDLGYEFLYDAQDGQGSVYLYDYASDSWWYTNPKIFPVLYDFTLNHWLYYYPDPKVALRYTSSPRVFYDYTLKQKITK